MTRVFYASLLLIGCTAALFAVPEAVISDCSTGLRVGHNNSLLDPHCPLGCRTAQCDRPRTLRAIAHCLTSVHVQACGFEYDAGFAQDFEHCYANSDLKAAIRYDPRFVPLTESKEVWATYQFDGNEVHTCSLDVNIGYTSANIDFEDNDCGLPTSYTALEYDQALRDRSRLSLRLKKVDDLDGDHPFTLIAHFPRCSDPVINSTIEFTVRQPRRLFRLDASPRPSYWGARLLGLLHPSSSIKS